MKVKIKTLEQLLNTPELLPNKNNGNYHFTTKECLGDSTMNSHVIGKIVCNVHVQRSDREPRYAGDTTNIFSQAIDYFIGENDENQT